MVKTSNVHLGTRAEESLGAVSNTTTVAPDYIPSIKHTTNKILFKINATTFRDYFTSIKHLGNKMPFRANTTAALDTLSSYLIKAAFPRMPAISTGNLTESITAAAGRTASSSTMGSSPQAQKKLLCHFLIYQLGNELFQYASVLGLAYTMDRIPVFIQTNDFLDSVLKTPASRRPDQKELEKRCERAKVVSEAACCRFDEALTQLDPLLDYQVQNFFQSWKYFDKYKNRILEAVRFADNVVEIAQSIVEKLKQTHNNSQLIGVQVRRGDFQNPESIQRGYVMATPQYIQRAFLYFIQRFPSSSFVFVAASNDIPWCREHFPKDYTVHYLENNSPAVDLQVLSMTDHVITSFGSYSWWAGYLNKGITVYIKDFRVPNTFLSKQFSSDASDYIYPGWVPL